jgi:hypothetical protein
MTLREGSNFAVMRASAGRGISFASPASITHLEGPVARQIASHA